MGSKILNSLALLNTAIHRTRQRHNPTSWMMRLSLPSCSLLLENLQDYRQNSKKGLEQNRNYRALKGCVQGVDFFRKSMPCVGGLGYINCGFSIAARAAAQNQRRLRGKSAVRKFTCYKARPGSCGNHRGVVGRERQRREGDAYGPPCGLGSEAGAEFAISRHSAGNKDALCPQALRRGKGFFSRSPTTAC